MYKKIKTFCFIIFRGFENFGDFKVCEKGLKFRSSYHLFDCLVTGKLAMKHPLNFPGAFNLCLQFAIKFHVAISCIKRVITIIIKSNHRTSITATFNRNL